MIGGEVCSRLVAKGHRVFALVHRNREVRGNDGRLVEASTVLQGDVTAPGFSLGEWEHSLDVIVHCAASLTFDAPEAELDAINVGGTSNAIELARAHGASLLHVSTAYVCGMTDGRMTERPVPASTRFANGYEASKARAEALVRDSGVPFVIVRPAIVLGDSASGAIRKFDAIYQAFAMIARGLLRTMPVTPDATLDFVPIDHVAGGIVALACDMAKANGATCHLTSGAPLPVADFAAAIGRYEQFHAPALVSAEGFDPATLPAIERRVFRSVAGAYASYFQRNPRFDDAVFRELTGLGEPQVGPAWMAKLIDYAIAEGLLPSERPDNVRAAASSRPAPIGSPP